MYVLEDFQRAAVNNLQHVLYSTSAQSVLLQSATGSGKTVIAGEFVSDHLIRNIDNNVLVLVNLQALVPQFYDTLTDFGLSVSVLHDEVDRNNAGERFVCDYDRRVLVTMPETLLNTMDGTNRKTGLHFDPTWKPTLILIDEAHKGTSTLFQIIRSRFPDALILGMTATPYRERNAEGELLTDWYGENLVTTISVRELIALGRLVRPRYHSFKEDDHVIETWKELTASSANKSTIIFTRDTMHSKRVKEAFLAAGITAELITAGSDVNPDEIITQQTTLQRQRIYTAFDRGDITLLISVMALCEGFDSQRAKFCLLLRGVGNHALFHQMIGRVLRSYKGEVGKDEGVIADFHGNLQVHGPIEDYIWELGGSAPDNMFLKENERTIRYESFERKSAIYCQCSGCHHVYDIKKHKSCQHCGRVHKVGKRIEVGELFRLRFNEGVNHTNFMSVVSQARGFAGMPEHQPVFNKRHQREVFTDGTFSPEYGFLAEIHSKMKWSDDFIMPI